MSGYTWRLDTGQYDQRVSLSQQEKEALQAWDCRRGIRASLREAVARLCKPLDEALALCNTRKWDYKSKCTKQIMEAVRERGRSYWGWSEKEWIETLGSRADSVVRPTMAGAAILLTRFRGYDRVDPPLLASPLARHVFGAKAFNKAAGELGEVLRHIGYCSWNANKDARTLLARLMLAAESSRFEDLTEPLIISCWSQIRTKKYSLHMLTSALVQMGYLEQPVYGRTYTRWNERSYEGADPEWIDWCKRWRITSTLGKKSKQTVFSGITRAGLWLKEVYPEVKSPQQWDVGLCAAFIAQVDRAKIGDYQFGKYRGPHSEEKPLSPRSKDRWLHCMRRFLGDLQRWQWIESRLDPGYHLSTPRSITRLFGPDPRDIEEKHWLRLIWASLHLEEPDTEKNARRYPFELLRALAVLWTHAGLRSDESLRLRLGCVREQSEPLGGPGESIAPHSVCFLHVPANKTSGPFVKPVADCVRLAIEAWERVRPAQVKLVDEKTGEAVDFLFQYRGKKITRNVINRVVIPILCRKAGVPESDKRGKITSHRGRASAVTMLANNGHGMSLAELMTWSGHKKPETTMHYLRVKPTKLAASFARADRVSHAVEVFIDQEAITSGAAGEGAPYMYYDLGESYCTNPFWSTCPHRMACAGCDFNMPKASATGTMLAAKEHLRRYLEEVPLTPDEQAAAAGDLQVLDKLLGKLKDVPTPDGKTPQQLKASRGSEMIALPIIQQPKEMG